MKILKNSIVPIFLSTAWIGLNEFFRNQFLFIDYWTEHYQGLGLTFPTEPINSAVWGVWSLVLVISIYIISGKFNLWHTTFLSWIVGFVLMWLVIGNMGVLPYKILFFAVPWSFLEVFGASYLCKKMIKS